MPSLTSAISGIVLAGLWTGLVAAQDARFGDVQLPIEPVPGQISIVGSRAWTWTDQSGSGLPVYRLAVERDVEIDLAGYALSADSAVLWISPRPDLGPETVQVFANLEGVGTPDADASVALAADSLSVQGVIRLTSPVELLADVVRDGPVDRPAAARAEAELKRFLGAIQRDEPPEPTPLEQLSADRPGEPLSEVVDEQDLTRNLPRASIGDPIMRGRGVLSLATGRIARTLDGQEQSIVLQDGVNITYREPDSDRVLELSAQRAVVFLNRSDAGSIGTLRASDVDGIYLEGDVIATDGKYTLRGPRVFYDVRNDKALILDAVFSTFDTSQGFPLYVRARSVRQISKEEFIADHARISNTAFARPNLTIGARSVTIQREAVRNPNGVEQTRTIADARNITVNALGVPIGFLPRFHGDPENLAIRDVRFVTSTENGAEVRTRWDLFSLLGMAAPEGLSVNLLADALVERGAALGAQATWAGEQFRGTLFSYWVLNDTGTDVLTSGSKVKRDGEYRGIIRAEHIAKVGRDWTVFAELSHVTDENVVDAFFEDLAETGREFKSRILARRIDDNSSLTLEVSGQFDDFTPNEYLLQTDGYAVQRLPEATYTRLSDDLLADIEPGLLTYSSQTRVGSLSLQFTDRTPAEYGLRSNAKAQTGLGINANTSIADSLRSQGFREESIFRLDSRHELTADLGVGPFDITPWIVGRATVYDSDFDSFGNGQENGERLWGAAGVTLATTIQHVNNELYSRPLDINRVRHILRPSFTAFYADGTVDQQNLPTYDESVESLAAGTVLRFGLDQTWQTQRGGPGRWYSVDWITLDAEAVVTSDDALRESPIGRYDESRPELSHLGNFGDISATMQVTDSLAIVGTSIYDFDRRQQVATSAGLVLEHSPTLSSSLRYRYLNDQNSTLVSGSSRYTLTDKYSISSSLTYDTDLGDIQSVRGELVRDFQAAVFGVSFNYNNINGQTSFGVLFQPLGRGSASKINTSNRSAVKRGAGRFGS